VIFNNPNILFVMAAPAEYGPELQKLITPLLIGIGPVEASVNVTAKLAELISRSQKPDLVVSLGSAGSRALLQTEVYQVSSISYRDMDVSALGFAPGQTPLTDIPVVVPLPHILDGLPAASLSTGASIITQEQYDTVDADMVDMETFAVWRSCQKFNIPMIGLRGISDGQKDLQQVSDWREYLHIIDEKLSQSLHLMKQTFHGWQDILATA